MLEDHKAFLISVNTEEGPGCGFSGTSGVSGSVAAGSWGGDCGVGATSGSTSFVLPLPLAAFFWAALLLTGFSSISFSLGCSGTAGSAGVGSALTGSWAGVAGRGWGA